MMPGVAARDGLRAPRAEDLVAAGAACLPIYLVEVVALCSTRHSSALLVASQAKRVQSPMPHTPRAVTSPVDGTKARCTRAGRGLRLHTQFACDVGLRPSQVIDFRPRMQQKRSLGFAHRHRLYCTPCTPLCCLHSMIFSWQILAATYQ